VRQIVGRDVLALGSARVSVQDAREAVKVFREYGRRTGRAAEAGEDSKSAEAQIGFIEVFHSCSGLVAVFDN
jgi:hypothetical protein